MKLNSHYRPLCVVLNYVKSHLQIASRPLSRKALGRLHLHIVIRPEETASVHHQVDYSGTSLCRAPEALPMPCPSLPSQPRPIEFDEFPFLKSAKLCQANENPVCL